MAALPFIMQRMHCAYQVLVIAVQAQISITASLLIGQLLTERFECSSVSAAAVA
jgi:hypothetical protein